MKKILFFLVTFLASFHMTVAQYPVFQSKEVLDGEIQTGYYILLPTDDLTAVQESWQSFLQKQGRLNKVVNQLYNVDALTSPLAREYDLSTLTSTVIGLKGFTKVFWSFQSRRSSGKDLAEIQAIANWLAPFIEDVQNWQSLKLKALEVEQFKAQQKTLDREVARLQSSIERNLKQQNKLDQSIRQTPEELSKIIQEKEVLTQSMIQQDVASEDLQKESKKKEKDIQKLRAQSKKNEKQLTSKEKSLQKLRTDFIKKEKERRLHQEVLDSKIK